MIHPKVSVILSVYNQAEYLPQAIASILDQSFTDFEFLIVDDASTDNTPKILSQFKDKRIKLLTNSTHQGLARTLNLAINYSRGEYLARIDADDIAYPKRLEIQLNYLIHHPHIAACGVAVDLVDSAGKKVGQKHYPAKITRTMLIRYNPIIHPTVMIRKEVCTYDENLNGAEDYDLWLRLSSKYQLANINQVLLAYRINPRGISWSSLKHIELQAIKARFKALTSYNYPLWQVIFMVKPILSYLIPSWVKKLLFNIK